MDGELFLKSPEYTIDSSSLMDIFGDTAWISKKTNQGLWEKVLDLIEQGIIISHAEVSRKLRKREPKEKSFMTGRTPMNTSSNTTMRFAKVPLSAICRGATKLL